MVLGKFHDLSRKRRRMGKLRKVGVVGGGVGTYPGEDLDGIKLVPSCYVFKCVCDVI